MTVRFLPPDEEQVPAPRDPSENFAKVVEMRSWLRPAEPVAAEDESGVTAESQEGAAPAAAGRGDDPAGAAAAAGRPAGAWASGERDAIVTRVQFGAPRGETIVEPPSAWGRARVAADAADAAAEAEPVSVAESVAASESGAAAQPAADASPKRSGWLRADDSSSEPAASDAETRSEQPAATLSAEAAAWAVAWEREAAGDGTGEVESGGYGSSRDHAEHDDETRGGYTARGGRRSERETTEQRRARREARKAEREAKAEADASDRGPVYDDAVRLLARRARSSGELASELLALDHSANEVSIIVDEFIESHYLDDIGLARAQCEKLRSSKGASKGQIRRKLRERKLPDHVIDEVCDELDSAEEFDLLRETAEKRAGQMKGLDRQTAERRLMGFLARRGWSGEAVTRAAREALDGAQGGRSARGPRFQ